MRKYESNCSGLKDQSRACFESCVNNYVHMYRYSVPELSDVQGSLMLGHTSMVLDMVSQSCTLHNLVPMLSNM